ncbi:MAG: MFS transporter [Nocardiopsaceae bacterium]|nr:MFS transporter [Nocardiopsaceae bacterium]
MTETRPGVVLAIVSLGVILSGIDLFIVNVAFPQIGAGLRVRDISDLSWLLNAYTIVFAALLIPLGRLADRSGRKAGFLLGVGLFTVASACCAAANSLALLIAFRALQGAGAALLTPTSLGLLLQAYPPRRRAGAVRIWTAMGSMAAVIGPVAGGLLVQASWRWVFLVNVPVGVVAIGAGLRRLPAARGDRGPFPDIAGTVLLIAAVGAAVLALVNGNQWQWDSARVTGLFAAAAVALALAVARSARHPSPALDLGLLRVPGAAAALASTLLLCTAFGAMIFSLVLLAENAWGWSALRGGLAVLPNAVLVLPTAMLAGLLLGRRRVTLAAVVTAGTGLYAAGILWWRWGVHAQPAYLPHLLIGLLLTGVGLGFTMPAIFGAATAPLPPHRFATGSALVNMVRQVGLTLGVAVLVAVLRTPASGAVGLAALDRGWVLIAIITVAVPLPLIFLRKFR